MKKSSLIISVYNEEAVLEKFYKAFCSIEQNLEYGGGGYELIFVNDGSTDASMNILEVIGAAEQECPCNQFFAKFWPRGCHDCRHRSCCGGRDHLHGCRPAAPSGMHRPHHGEI